MCRNKWTHLIGRDKRFVIFSPQWVRRASSSSARLVYNVTDTLETRRRQLIEISIVRSNSRNNVHIMIIPLRFHCGLQSLRSKALHQFSPGRNIRSFEQIVKWRYHSQARRTSSSTPWRNMLFNKIFPLEKVFRPEAEAEVGEGA